MVEQTKKVISKTIINTTKEIIKKAELELVEQEKAVRDKKRFIKDMKCLLVEYEGQGNGKESK